MSGIGVENSTPIGQLSTVGYTVLPDVFPAGVIDVMRAQVDAAMASDPRDDVHLWDNLTGRHEVFRDAVQGKPILDLVDAVLGDDCILSGTIARTSMPGHGEQDLHRDTSFWSPTMTCIRPCLGLNVVVPLDDFTEDNGATRLLPGTHGAPAEPVATDALPLVLPAGSCAIYDLDLYHSGTDNRTDRPRRAIFFAYLRSWIKPMVDHRRSTPEPVVREATPTLRRLLGFKGQSVSVAEDGAWTIVDAPGATSFYGKPQGAGVYG